MSNRILNTEMLLSHGNIEMKKDAIEIMEQGLYYADPYNSTRDLLELDGNILKVGNTFYEAENDPTSGVDTLDLTQFDRIYVVGAGKGVQRIAKAIEDVLGDWLTGGAVISKHGDPLILKRITNTYGDHPTPDQGCIEGAKKIMELTKDITERDLVFTIITNGGSSLLTLPYEGISLEDIVEITRIIQIELGLHTLFLNYIRHHIDQLKAGRMTRLFSPAKMYHLIGADANRTNNLPGKQDYYYFMHNNDFLHNLPNGSVFADAQKVLEDNNIVDRCPKSIRDFIYEAKPEYETVKYEEYKKTDSRFFGLTPDNMWLKAASDKARELGYEPYVLLRSLTVDAQAAAQVMMGIATNISDRNEPFSPPVALITGGEMLVAVNNATGVGGTNQEFALTAAHMIGGSERIVTISTDTDGTDGPGGIDYEGAPECLGGGIVDGYTSQEAADLGIDIPAHLRNHDTSIPLWRLGCGVEIDHGVSVLDIGVTLIR